MVSDRHLPAVLDTPLPTKMRQVYALLGLVKKWGPDKVDAPADGRSMPKRFGLIGRMLERATENVEQGASPAPPATTSSRDPGEFTTDAAKARRSA